MSEHKGAIFLMIVSLIIFGILAAFYSDNMPNIIDTLGGGFSQMMTNLYGNGG
ncbi:hypothetical protein NST12_16780 [Bacillus sp. FSL W8-1127]|uniref:hypothetical protein n=1 Tax=Bacillus sp. FSL W8-1127 TaxID=2954710 RepID=UPI0030F8392A